MKVNVIELNAHYPVKGGTLKCIAMESPWSDGHEDWKRPAVVIAPGGGYTHVSKREGEPIALSFLEKGFQAFILTYVCSPEARYPEQLIELASAVDYVRKHADEYSVNPNEVFVIGFSAGGHLAACTGTLWSHACLEEYLDQNREIYRPNAMFLAYPVINVASHKGSYLNLFSQREEDLTKEMQDLLNLENQVTKGTPPTFLWHTTADSVVPAKASLQFALALAEKKIPYEIRVWTGDRHGTGLGNYVTEPKHAPLEDHACAAWVKDSVDFFFKTV
mgnify:CR=1 FL=1